MKRPAVTGPTRNETPDVPWGLMVGMRNVLAHDYGGVDLEQVYRVVTENLPDLLGGLGDLIARLERKVGWEDEGESSG